MRDRKSDAHMKMPVAPGNVRHHKDENKENNSPDNLEEKTRSAFERPRPHAQRIEETSQVAVHDGTKGTVGPMDPKTLMTAQEMSVMKQILENKYFENKEQEHYRGIEVTEARKNLNGSVSMTVTAFENIFNNERIFTEALRAAVQETIQQIASVIINERRQEIEDACNFGELRDVLAAELARQFMASRLTGTPTPFDSRQMIVQGRKPSIAQALAAGLIQPATGTSQP